MWPATTSRGGALAGLNVVDLSRVLAGPLCTQMLSDQGADVIKVEPPGGDETRDLGPPFNANGEAAYFGALNRGKRGLALDLAQAGAREVLHRLLADADVLVENFVPGTLERWSLGFETLSARYPRLIHCTITGFGVDGPLGGLPGYDAVLQAMCGLMSVNGEPASGATRVGVPIVDHLTGYVAMTAILMALHSRDRTGQGQHVEATLFDTAISLLMPHAANHLVSGKTPGLLGSAHPNIAPYDKYWASDEQVFIGVLNDAQFKRLCAHLGGDGLSSDARFATNAQRLLHRDQLKTELEALLAKVEASAVCDALMRIGVPASPVNSVPDALRHPHTRHRGLLVEREHHTGVRSPARLEGTPGTPGAAPPAFAQDSAAILGQLGFDANDIARLNETGAAPSGRSRSPTKQQRRPMT
jgi:crotonobetainyl-CoA:carnitine CoA-transferase CaiB-like acyl-CoA transferase